jgi:hypothetical protein
MKYMEASRKWQRGLASTDDLLNDLESANNICSVVRFAQARFAI